MKAREHTAQLISEEAAEIQQEFVRGEVNALSCSTAFELGVDVGELQSVVMRNMPPTTANYVQRAGRAGRRTDSAALVLAYAQRRSHDLRGSRTRRRWWRGGTAPYVSLGNDRIDRRHAHSVALAAFFRHAKELTRRCGVRGDSSWGPPAPWRGLAVPFAGAVIDHGIAAAGTACGRAAADQRRDRRMADELCLYWKTYVRSSARTLTGLRSGAGQAFADQRGISPGCTSGRSTP